MDNRKVMAVTNQKGGVGKTMITVNLGVGLVRQGKKVLLVDTDPQGSLTVSLGVKNVESKAGVGFGNAAQVGNLKIVKTSSDKKGGLLLPCHRAKRLRAGVYHQRGRRNSDRGAAHWQVPGE